MASLLTSSQRRKDMYKAGTKVGTDHRQRSAVSIRKKKRQKHLTSKRMKLTTASTSTHQQPTLTHDAIHSLVTPLLTTLRNNASAVTRALKQLRKLLSENASASEAATVIVDLGGVPLLIQYLASSSAEQRLETTWCLSNIASGTHDEAQHVLAAVPYLIGFLTGPEPALREQSLW